MEKITKIIETSPRIMECEKRVNDIIEEFSEYDTKTEYHVHDNDKEIIFTNEMYKEDKDGLTRRQFVAKLEKVEITNEILNTGNILLKEVEQKIKDENGNVILDEKGNPKVEIKTVKYVERLNTFTLIHLYIK